MIEIGNVYFGKINGKSSLVMITDYIIDGRVKKCWKCKTIDLNTGESSSTRIDGSELICPVPTSFWGQAENLVVQFYAKLGRIHGLCAELGEQAKEG